MTVRWLAAVFLLGGGLLACREAGEGAAPIESAGAAGGSVVAVVNGVSILRQELQSTLAQARKALPGVPGELGDRERSALESRILDKMIADELLVHHARARGVRVTPEELEERFQQIVDSGGGDGAFYVFLEESGLDRERILANLERNLTIERLAAQLREAETVSAEEVADHYREHRDSYRRGEAAVIAHILFQAGGDREDPLQRARAARREIARGLPFERAALKYSDDALTREKGGLLGMVGRGELLAPLEQAAFSLELRAVSDPVGSPLGVHLLQVLERREGERRPLDDVREEIRQEIRNSRVERKMEDLAERLAREGNIRRE